MGIIASTRIVEKLSVKHNVSLDEVAQCFANRTGRFLRDVRAEHHTNPPTQWFISETNSGRKLKVVFIRNGSDVEVKTAFDPNQEEFRIYEKFA